MDVLERMPFKARKGAFEKLLSIGYIENLKQQGLEIALARQTTGLSDDEIKVLGSQVEFSLFYLVYKYGFCSHRF